MTESRNALASLSISFVATRAAGLSGAPPKTYAEFLRCALATQTGPGDWETSNGWRARLPAIGIRTKALFAQSDEAFYDFDVDRLFSGAETPPASLIPAFGAVSRTAMLWAGQVLVHAARFNFLPNWGDAGDPEAYWRDLAEQGVIALSKSKRPVEDTDPRAHARLYRALYDHLALPDRHDMPDMLDLFGLLGEKAYRPPAQEADPTQNFGFRKKTRVVDQATFGLAVLAAGGAERESGEEWTIWPIALPPQATRLQKGGRLAFAIAARRSAPSLKVECVERFATAFDHVSAHVRILQEARQFLERWWDPLLLAASWNEKRQGAGRFLREWQLFIASIPPAWTLGSDDIGTDPDVVRILDDALGLSPSWAVAHDRLQALLALASEVVADADPSVLM